MHKNLAIECINRLSTYTTNKEELSSKKMESITELISNFLVSSQSIERDLLSLYCLCTVSKNLSRCHQLSKTSDFKAMRTANPLKTL